MFSRRELDYTLDTDFKVRVVLNAEAKAALKSIDGYEPLLSSINIPSSPVNFSRIGVAVVSSYSEPAFSFSFIPQRGVVSIGMALNNGKDPLILLDRAQYSKNGLLIPKGGIYSLSYTVGYGDLTQCDGLYYETIAENGFPIKIGFDIYNVVTHDTLYRFRNCRITVVQSSATVSGENFATYNVNVYSDSVIY